MAPVQIIANHMRQEQEESFIRRLRTYHRKYSDTPGKPPFISWASTFCVLTLLAFHKELTSPPLFMYHFTVTRRNISFPILRNPVHFPLGTDCFSSFHPLPFSSHVLVGFLSLLHHRRPNFPHVQQTIFLSLLQRFCLIPEAIYQFPFWTINKALTLSRSSRSVYFSGGCKLNRLDPVGCTVTVEDSTSNCELARRLILLE